MTNYIGIDIGASFIKGALLDVDRLSITNILKYPTPGPNRNNVTPLLTTRFEVNGKLYCQKVNKMIIELLEIDKSVAGIIVSSQMHGTILVNSRLVEVTPFIGWQDERILELSGINRYSYLDIIEAKLANIGKTHTGIKFRSGIMGSTLFWLKEHNAIPSYPNYTAMFLGDYVAAKLTKGALVTESTQACGSGLFNIITNKWDEKIIRALGLNISNLPKVVTTGEIVGNYKYRQRDIPVHVSVGDLQAAVLGSLIKQEQVLINIGTGSQVSTINVGFKSGEYDIRSYFDNTYLNTITHLPAGRALNVVIDLVKGIQKKVFESNKKIDIWAKLNKLIENKQDSDHMVNRISYYQNNASPYKSGLIDKISEHNLSIENIFFSALENMVTNYHQAYLKLHVPKKHVDIICSGGLIRRSKKLLELIRTKFDNKIGLALYEEETLTGLLTLAIFCHKKLKTVKSATDILRKGKVTFS